MKKAMSESEKEIPIPMSERVKISDLKFDQDNPNRMSLAQLDRLKASIRRGGDIVPVVTNSELWWRMGSSVLPL
jgi:hypothetical protein